MRTILATLFFVSFCSIAQAGTWHCEAGLGSAGNVVKIDLDGDELGQVASQATVTIAAFPAKYTSRNDEVETDELARVTIGEEDPRSHMRLRIANEMFDETNKKAFVLLVNMPIKQELEGYCGFSN